MADHVFILGAGASAEVGGPLMKGFLDAADDLVRQGRLTDVKPQITSILELWGELQATYAKVNMDLFNIESMFGLLEMGRVIGMLGGHDKEAVSRYRQALVTLIVRTLEERIKIPVQHRKAGVFPQFAEFVSLLRELKSCAVITFNYDMALDYALHQSGIPVDYGLAASQAGRFKLLKLHGSMNWARTADGSEVVPYELSVYLQDYHWDIWDDEEKHVLLAISQHLGTLGKHLAGKTIDSLPVIVPPTWSKTEYNSILAPVWVNAVRELRDARHIYVSGYSLPDSDSFFPYLLALGMFSPAMVRRFWVFDVDDTGQIEQRYRRLLGSSVAGGFKYVRTHFSDMAGHIRPLLQAGS